MEYGAGRAFTAGCNDIGIATKKRQADTNYREREKQKWCETASSASSCADAQIESTYYVFINSLRLRWPRSRLTGILTSSSLVIGQPPLMMLLSFCLYWTGSTPSMAA